MTEEEAIREYDRACADLNRHVNRAIRRWKQMEQVAPQMAMNREAYRDRLLAILREEIPAK